MTKVSSNLSKSEVTNATNWAAGAFLGILVPILGLVFGLIGESKARKLLELDTDNKELKRARNTAIVGIFLSAAIFLVEFYLYLSR